MRFARENSLKSVFSDNGYKLYGHPNSNCTNFISYALLAGGLLEGSTWQKDSGAWIRTNELYTFLITVGFTPSGEFVSSNNHWYIKQLNSEDKLVATEDKYLPFRLNGQDTREKRQLLDNGNVLWSEYLDTISNARPGDLVFYMNYTDIWSHVGIITEDWTSPTYYSFPEGIEAGTNEPQMIDHDGITENVPRSIGDTSSFKNQKMIILYGP